MRKIIISLISVLLLVFLILFIIYHRPSHLKIDLLEEAYKEKSNEKLEAFFESWENDIHPISDKEFKTLSDTIKEAYKAFVGFYNPFEIKKGGKMEWEDNLYKELDYLIIQADLTIRVRNKIHFTDQETDSISKEIESKYDKASIDSISHSVLYPYEDWGLEEIYNNDVIYYTRIPNFRPNISINNKKVVYLTEPYFNELMTFLGTHIKETQEGYRVEYTRYLEFDEIHERKRFLEQKVKVTFGHWGAYWHLVTFPQVFSIVLDKDMQYAKVFFRIMHEGGEAILKKKDGEWSILSSRKTWIE